MSLYILVDVLCFVYCRKSFVRWQSSLGIIGHWLHLTVLRKLISHSNLSSLHMHIYDIYAYISIIEDKIKLFSKHVESFPIHTHIWPVWYFHFFLKSLCGNTNLELYVCTCAYTHMHTLVLIYMCSNRYICICTYVLCFINNLCKEMQYFYLLGFSFLLTSH